MTALAFENQTLPPGAWLEVTVVSDRTIDIRYSLHDGEAGIVILQYAVFSR